MTMIDYSKRRPNTFSKAESHMDEVWGKPDTSFQSPLPVKSHSNVLCDNMYEMLPPGKLIKALESRVFTRAGHPGILCLHIPNFQTSCRKVRVCINSIGIVSHSSVLGMVGTLQRFRFPARVKLISKTSKG